MVDDKDIDLFCCMFYNISFYSLCLCCHLLIMRINTLNTKRAIRGIRLSEEHRWFAWYPVVIGDQWVWLEFVTRRAMLYSDGTIKSYRYTFTKE